jgi:hypothetical protein
LEQPPRRKMMKRFPLLVLVCLVAIAAALPASAQEGLWLGVKGGYGSPSPDVSTDLLILKGTDDSGGVVAGLAVEGGWWKDLTLEGEVLYVSRKATNTYFGGTDDHGNYQGDVSAEYTFETLEIPLHAKYAFGDGSVRPFLIGGGSVAVPLKIESVNRAGSFTSTENAEGQFDDVWFALEGGAGLDLKAGDSTVITLEGRYIYGLTNTPALSGDTWKMRDWRILGGIKFRM